MKPPRITIAAIIVVLTLATTIPVTAAPDAPNAVPGGTLVVAVSTDPQTLNGAMTTSTPATTVAGAIYDSLVIADAAGTPTPNLATSWEVSADAQAYTFRLVKNAKWHDGTPFTSADVKFTVENVWKPLHPRNRLALQNLDRVDTPDPYTAVIRFKKPYAALLGSLGNYDGYIVAKHIYEGSKIQDNPHNMKDPIGTGPFKLQEWVKGDHLTLVRNPDYWKVGRPYLDKIVFKIIPDPSARRLALEAGEVDLIPYSALPPYSDLGALKGKPGIVIHEVKSVVLAGVSALMFNLRRPTLADLQVRQAFAHAIDRDLLVDRVMFGFARAANGPFSPPWYDEAAVTKYARDLTKANQLLDSAGLKRGADGTRVKMTLRYDQARNATAKTAQVIREQMREVGVDIQLIGTDLATFDQTVFLKHDFDIAIPAEFVGTGPDPVVGIARFYLSTNIGDATLNNGAAYKNPKVDDAFAKSMAATDPKERQKLFSSVQTEVTRDLPYLWMMAPKGVVLYRAQYGNVDWTDPYEVDLANVYVKSAEQQGVPAWGAGLGLIAVLALAGGLVLFRARRARG